MPDVFPFTGRLFFPIPFSKFQLTLPRLLAKIAFYDEFCSVFVQYFDKFPVIVARINPHNDLPEINFQRFHLFQTAPEKFHRSILAC